MRSLDADERELWARVTATIRPLSRKPIDSSGPDHEAAQRTVEAERRTPHKPRPAARAPARAAAPPRDPAGSLDSGWDRRLRSGSVQPDRTLDLHGLNLDQAWQAIDHGLERAIAAGDRVLLLVTGHARPGDPPVQRGKIRAAVHDWLEASRHSASIAAVRGAHKRHGGGGSLYIILRRNRRKSTVS